METDTARQRAGSQRGSRNPNLYSDHLAAGRALHVNEQVKGEELPHSDANNFRGSSSGENPQKHLQFVPKHCEFFARGA